MRTILVRCMAVLMASTFMISGAAAMDVYIINDNSTLGKFIADENRMTLYTFQKDTPGKSMCGKANDCIKKWPVFYAETIDAEVPIKNSDFATIVRDDGMKQTTYKGMPLYYFSKDAKTGDAQGHGVNGSWAVARP